MHVLSTRTFVTARSGLAAGIADLAPLAPPALVLESAAGAGPLADAEAILRRIRCPVLACIGPVLEAPRYRQIAPTLASGAGGDRDEAVAGLKATMAFMARVRCPTLIIEAGTGDVGGIGDARRKRTVATAPPSEVLATWLRDARKEREAAVGHFCRGLDALARAAPSIHLLLLPDSDPYSLLDLETTEWVLDDLRSLGVHLALDTGHLGLREAQGGSKLTEWLDRHAASVDLLFLSDHDATVRSDLLPGSGRLDFSSLRGTFSHTVSRILRPDPGLPSAACRDADDFLMDRFGPRSP